MGLAASGQRLINSLSNDHGGQDDALMLRRRLDDMNRRWHGLRAKTVAIRYIYFFKRQTINLKKNPTLRMMSSNRNRLENNTEHWNALLLSLRELIEWVIRKDTELTGLGPIRGDLSTLVKQQV